MINDERYYGLFNDSYPPIIDGVTLTVQNYVKGVIDEGLRPCVVTPWNPETVPSASKVMKYFSLPIWNRQPYRYGYPKLDPFIWHRLRHTPFKIAHAHCPFSSGRLAVYVKRYQHIPLVGTFHSKYRSDLAHSFASVPWMVPIIMKRILHFFNACDEVWIPQARVEETVREYGYKGPLVVMPNGNDMAAGFNITAQDARSRLGLNDDELCLLFVGQHIWEKGIGVIADALKMLNPTIPFRMHFIGEGYAKKELTAKITNYGLSDKVKVHGLISNRQELATYYAAADIFLFPSFYDNAPLVMREAAAFSTPTIVPEGSTAAEVIINGDNGYCVPRTAEKYAEIIAFLHRHPEKMKATGQNARNTLITPWSEVMHQVMDRYETLIKHHQP